MEKDENMKIHIEVDTMELKQIIKTAKKLKKTLKKANSLADELASKELNIPICMKY